jgi:hypothetical protein
MANMATILKNTEVKKGFGAGTVSGQVKSHANDPYVVKKVEEAAKTIQRVGLPRQKKK